MKQIKVAFGLTLVQLRARKDMSQEAVARESGLDRTFISLIERGNRQPTITTLVILADALDVPLKEMIARFERNLRGTFSSTKIDKRIS